MDISVVDLNRVEVYEAGASLITLLAYPREREEVWAQVHASLCNYALRILQLCAQNKVCVGARFRIIVDGPTHAPDCASIPACVFTVPALASVGLTQAAAEEQGIELYQPAAQPLHGSQRTRCWSEQDFEPSVPCKEG